MLGSLVGSSGCCRGRIRSTRGRGGGAPGSGRAPAAGSGGGPEAKGPGAAGGQPPVYGETRESTCCCSDHEASVADVRQCVTRAALNRRRLDWHQAGQAPTQNPRSRQECGEQCAQHAHCSGTRQTTCTNALSSCLQNYIYFGEKSVKEVVDCMWGMEWLYRNTGYRYRLHQVNH